MSRYSHRPRDASRLINAVLCFFEFLAAKKIMEFNIIPLLSEIKYTSASIDSIADNVSAGKELVRYLLNYLDCIKIVKKKGNYYSLSSKSNLYKYTDRLREVTHYLNAEMDPPILSQIGNLIADYNKSFLIRNLAYFTKVREKEFCRDILPCLTGRASGPDFAYYDDISVTLPSDMNNIIIKKKTDQSIIIGGFSLTKKETGPKYGLLLKIASLIYDYPFAFNDMHSIYRRLKKDDTCISMRTIRAYYSYVYLIINPYPHQHAKE